MDAVFVSIPFKRESTLKADETPLDEIARQLVSIPFKRESTLKAIYLNKEEVDEI